MMPVVPSWKLSWWLHDIECMTQERLKTSSRQSWPSVALSSASLYTPLYCVAKTLKFQAYYITIKDSLWYVILLNNLLKIPWCLGRIHMISRSWLSCSLHVVEAHLLLKIFKPFTGRVAVLLTQSLQSICIVPTSSPSLQYHLLPTFSVHLPSHTQKVLSTFLRKGSQWHTQEMFTLNGTLALMFP